ncbi:hypothetical protein EJ07DRAFT_173591 [Lizonia empirigonia]|nr:hypothetical protein EJ07DRAFT_173591 [Lizonia empirigonia]
MNDIYGTLANSTFIPHNAVQQGPHHISTTAPPCRPSAAVLRLVKLLPYVDSSLVHEPDWLYGRHFMDYRNPDHLAELCHPLRGQSIGWTDYMAPSDVALTNWGTGGWNNDRTWVLIYNTERDSIRIFNAEEWLHRESAQDEFGAEMNAWWFEDSEWIWDRPDGAPLVLPAIANNYLSLKRTPWETSNREPSHGLADRHTVNKVDPFGLENDYLKQTLKRSGWPHTFDPVEFNAEVISAQHAPRSQNMAEAIQARIDSIVSAKNWALTHKLKAAELANHTETCDERFNYLEHLNARMGQEHNYHTDSRLEACVINEEIKFPYLRRASLDSETDALRHCEETGCQLLRAEDTWARARLRSAECERSVGEAKARIDKTLTFASQLPADAADALFKTSEFVSGLEQKIKNCQDMVEHTEMLIRNAREGGDDLYNALVLTYEINRPLDFGHEREREAYKEYQRWMWMHQVQKQTERREKPNEVLYEYTIPHIPHPRSARALRQRPRLSSPEAHRLTPRHPQDPTGSIPYAQARLAQHSSTLALATTPASRALHKYRIQRTHWDISDQTTSLAAARAEVATLCPNTICVPPASLILWELHAHAHAHREAQAHCAQTGCSLLPPPTIAARVVSHIAGLCRGIDAAERRIYKMYDEYADQIPEGAEAAWTEFNMNAEHLAQGNRNAQAEIE